VFLSFSVAITLNVIRTENETGANFIHWREDKLHEVRQNIQKVNN